ncbi:hypothetical protein F7P69_08425 [Cellulosimicrobium funkei]|nr:hypothetical protein [Cellulosimicrobium funkei]
MSDHPQDPSGPTDPRNPYGQQHQPGNPVPPPPPTQPQQPHQQQSHPQQNGYLPTVNAVEAKGFFGAHRVLHRHGAYLAEHGRHGGRTAVMASGQPAPLILEAE